MGPLVALVFVGVPDVKGYSVRLKYADSIVINAGIRKVCHRSLSAKIAKRCDGQRHRASFQAKEDLLEAFLFLPIPRAFFLNPAIKRGNDLIRPPAYFLMWAPAKFEHLCSTLRQYVRE
jgi:hypothetical protein